jgi:L-threonylcarbamoyladenylate synthase
VTALRRFDLTRGALTADEERTVVDLLMRGALVVYPTDTLYAIGCRALDPSAVRALRSAKARDADKALPVIAANLDQARSLAREWSPEAERLAASFWPGPLTLVLKASAAVPPEVIASTDSVAIRVPSSPFATRLAELVGPLISTSANLAGEPPCVTVDLALAVFPAATLAFDAGPLDGAPSTIVEVGAPGAVRVLREGRVSIAALRERLEAGGVKVS